jgi:hypothetical protein
MLADSMVFKMDETSHTVVPRPEKIIAQKGKHQVGATSRFERRQNVTELFLCSPIADLSQEKDTGCRVPQALFYLDKTKAGWIMKCPVNGSVMSSQL